jgi:hypothetical protein
MPAMIYVICVNILACWKKIEKIKNSSQRAKATALGEGGAQHCAGYSSSQRAEDTALEEEPFERIKMSTRGG